ncbi:MAG: hypothetical protein KAS72_08580 [Phycisphaerales bacterium]|nr:hypothetical protein [Phycisphaerales bacterium]
MTISTMFSGTMRNGWRSVHEGQLRLVLNKCGQGSTGLVDLLRLTKRWMAVTARLS